MVLVLWSSIDRSYGSDENFTITAPQSLTGYSQVRLRGCRIMNSLYNVTSVDGRDTLYFTVADDADGTNAVEYQATIPIGNYQMSDLISRLRDAMEAEIDPITVTITYSDITGRMSFGLSDKYLQIRSLPTFGLNLLLGFSKTNDTEFATTVVAPRVANLVRYSALVLCTNILGNRSYVSASNEKLGILDTIPLPPAFDVYEYRPNHPTNFLNLASSNITTTNFFLLDEEGATVDLNKTYISVLLELI
jgi:hypothetical protein